MTAAKTTTIVLTPTTRRQLAEIGGQQSETIRRAVAVLWTLEVAGHFCANSGPESHLGDPRGGGGEP